MPLRPSLLRAALVALALGACSSPATTPPADAAPPDVAIDAPTAPPADRVELSAGGRLTGGSLTADVQLGGGLAPRPATGGTLTATPAAPVVP